MSNPSPRRAWINLSEAIRTFPNAYLRPAVDALPVHQAQKDKLWEALSARAAEDTQGSPALRADLAEIVVKRVKKLRKKAAAQGIESYMTDFSKKRFTHHATSETADGKWGYNHSK